MVALLDRGCTDYFRSLKKISLLAFNRFEKWFNSEWPLPEQLLLNLHSNMLVSVYFFDNVLLSSITKLFTLYFLPQCNELINFGSQLRVLSLHVPPSPTLLTGLDSPLISNNQHRQHAILLFLVNYNLKKVKISQFFKWFKKDRLIEITY